MQFLPFMLAEWLEENREELLRYIEWRAERTGHASLRSERVGENLEELTAILRSGDGSPTARDGGVQDGARELIADCVIEAVVRHSLTPPAVEVKALCDWAQAVERSKLREGYRRLSDLLDDI